MERINPLSIIRYILISGSLLVMFFNLFDCIVKSNPLSSYVLYVGLFLVIALLLMFIESQELIVWIIYVVATLTLVLDNETSTMSYALIFFCLISYLKRDLYFRVLIYFTTLLSLVILNVFYAKLPSDLINVLIGYIIVYSVSELVYLEIKNRHRGME